MNTIRCFHEGITFKKLPEGVDPRGPQELTALHRAHNEQAWRHRPQRRAVEGQRVVVRGEVVQ